MKRLKDKVALITGGGSGIGRTTAQLFAEEGAKIIVADIEEKGGQDTTTKLISAGTESLFVQVDVTQTESVKTMVQRALDRFGRVDVLFHAAGIFEAGLITEVDEAHWDKIIDINLKGTFLVLKYVIPPMLEIGGGTIVTVASIAGFAPFPNNAVYVASKAGVIMFTKSIARDYGELGIRANSICPGPVLTPMIFRSAEKGEADLELLSERTLLKRLANPEEIAKVVLFLASDESSYITGESIVIDGGKMTMNK